MTVTSSDTQSKSTVTTGQGYAPDDDTLAEILRQIYRNKYYTNHGPLAIEFETSLSSYLNVSNAVVSTNATLALVMTLVALDAAGTAVVPSICSPGVVEAVIWAGLAPVFCDVDRDTGHMTADTVRDAIREDTSIIIASSLWGYVFDTADLTGTHGHAGLKIIHYAEGAFGATVNGASPVCDSDAAIFSFDSGNILSTTGGGCLATNDELLARRVRNIRSSYGAGIPEKVPVTANGRFSEYQAALGLWSLSRLEAHRARNKSIFDMYKRSLGNIDGMHLLETGEHILSNYQDAVLCVHDPGSGATRDRMRSILDEHGILTMNKYAAYLENTNVFAARGGGNFPNTRHFAKAFLPLPVGSRVTPDMADRIGSLLESCFRQS